MKNRPFIGMGSNPDGPDLPLGLGMRLEEEPEATSNYGRLTQEQQAAVVRYIQACTTGEDAQNRIEHAVQCLKENDFGRIFP